MRRSAAPSQGNPAKRPKFSVPFKNVTPIPVQYDQKKFQNPSRREEKQEKQRSNNDELHSWMQSENKYQVTDSKPASAFRKSGLTVNAHVPRVPAVDYYEPVRVINDVTKVIDHVTTVIDDVATVVDHIPEVVSRVPEVVKHMPTVNRHVPADNKPSVRTPLHSMNKLDENSTRDAVLKKSRYLSVMWCKASSKKHKKWEGDAILETSGRSVTLYDTDGKVIGKGTGYKSTELETLKEDETLKIGGKEIQVMSLLSEEQFKSGKCFQAVCTDTSKKVNIPVREKSASKQYVNPQLLGNNTEVMVQTTPSVCQPRHDPKAPGALVLPRPNSNHQWQFNTKKLPLVDVVVDPYLSIHLRPHQREGVIFLYECLMGFRSFAGTGAILADDMGLGKTLQCIATLWTLYKQGPYGGKPVIKRALIITPGSLVKNWYQEIKKWLGMERLPVYSVNSDNRVEDFVNTAIYPVLIISYEMFVRAFDIIQKLKFDLIICDEGHRLKNTTIKTTSLIMSLPTRRRIVLTGTPIQNDLQEFFSIVEFCNPGFLGTSGAFKRVYETPIVASRQPGATPHEKELGEERGSELSRITKLFILRRTQEVNNQYLPPKCDIVIFCRPSDLQIQLYRKLLSGRVIRSCLSGSFDGFPHLICIGALKQLCNHPNLLYNKACAAAESFDDIEEGSVYSGLLPVYPSDFNKDVVDVSHSGKLVVLAGLLESISNSEKREKIVLVSNHTKTLDLLQRFCENMNYGYLRLDGQTPTIRRQEIVTKFNSKHSVETVFLLSSKAGGQGLNLVGASRLLLYDIDWNPANDLQAMARIWRDGQKGRVYIYRLLTTGTIEEKIYQRQISKQGLSGAIMDSKDKSEVQFSKEDLKDLFSLNENTDCDTHELLNCQCHLDGNPVNDIEDNASVIRPCQLGASSGIQKRKNLAMDELMEWKHLQNSFTGQQSEWMLGNSLDSVTFSFSHETSS